MKTKVERIYSKIIKSLMYSVNPIKKIIIKTHCTVHKFINMESIELLKQNNHCAEYEFYIKNIKALNDGATWADQDFKSSNHFYHVERKKGLYGFSNALSECEKYYNKACIHYKEGDIYNALFYFGSACHLLQDVTVPQHVNNKLLKRHRDFELWIISKIFNDYSFKAHGDIIEYDKIEEYIVNNAKVANEIYSSSVNIYDKEKRYRKIAVTGISQAEKTTAGFMMKFYKDIGK